MILWPKSSANDVSALMVKPKKSSESVFQSLERIDDWN